MSKTTKDLIKESLSYLNSGDYIKGGFVVIRQSWIEDFLAEFEDLEKEIIQLKQARYKATFAEIAVGSLPILEALADAYDKAYGVKKQDA